MPIPHESKKTGKTNNLKLLESYLVREFGEARSTTDKPNEDYVKHRRGATMGRDVGVCVLREEA